MSIQQSIVYDEFKDEIVGYVDYGHEKIKVYSKSVCIFMIRSICANFKQILYYVASPGSIPAEILKTEIERCIHICNEMGLNILGIVCDQGPTNRKFLNECSYKKPCINLKNKEIYAIYNVPHLLKSVRNNIYQAKLPTTDGIVNWEVIAFIYDEEKQKTTRICPKLTYNHVHPNSFQKMNVRLAAQVLSHSVASAIKTFLELDKYPENLKAEALSTAAFVEKFNRLFDFLNGSPPMIRDKENIDFLRYMQNYVLNISSVKGKNLSHCFKGFALSIESIINITDNLFFKYPNINAIDGRKFNQDVLENFNAHIRARNCNKINPNLFEFAQAFAKLISIKLLFSSKFSNCEDDKDEILAVDWKAVFSCDTISNFSSSNTEQNNDIVPFISEPDLDFPDFQANETIGEVDTSHVATAYFTGYCIYKLMIYLKSPCENCIEDMIEYDSDDSDLTLTFFKFKQFEESRDFIKPSKRLYEICKLHTEVFTTIFKSTPHIKNIKEHIVNKCIERTKLTDLAWFDLENSCYSHRYKLLDFMILVLLRKNCKWIEKENIKRKKSKNRKMTTVLNI